MRTGLKKAPEQKYEGGAVPACTGARLRIVEIIKGKVMTEGSKTQGFRKYTPVFEILEPKALKGRQVRDHRCVVGTPNDPLAKKDETWEVEEGGAARLARLMIRGDVPVDDDADDEEWMEAAVDHEVVASISKDGTFNSLGLYYRPSDEDAPEIGIATEDDDPKAKGKSKPASTKRSAKPDDEDDDDEDEKPKGKKSKSDDDEDEDEPKAKKGKKAKKQEEDDDEDDD